LPFQIARYSVTYKQFQAFIDSPDGYPNREINWFEGLAASDEDKRVEHQRFKFPNHPRETVNWYEAIAFCRWLSWRLERAGWDENATLLAGLAGKGWPEDEVVPRDRSGSASEAKASSLLNSLNRSRRRTPAKVGKFDLMDPFTWAVRLPTEAEWQFAASGPSAGTYPWGKEWDGRFANTRESGLGRTTAGGMYPAGAAPCGALDMSGNVWEWTLTEHESGKSNDITNQESRVVRGGSWNFNQYFARATYRFSLHPDYRHFSVGFRVVGVVPSH